jgi:hypothetical protein
MKVELGDVTISLTKINLTTYYLVNVTVHTENILSSGVNVTLKGQNAQTGLISYEKYTNTPAISDSDKYTSVTFILNIYELTSTNYLHIYIDQDNSIAEPKTDNYVMMPSIIHKFPAKLSIDTGYGEVDDAVRKYLQIFFTDDPTEKDTVVIGRYASEVKNFSEKTLLLKENPYGLSKDGFKIMANEKVLDKTYNAIVGNYWDGSPYFGGNYYVFAYGTGIEGTVAAVKKLISAKAAFFSANMNGDFVSNKALVVVDNYDVTGISTFDLMHNEENQPSFGKNNSQFTKAITKILNDNNFEMSIKTVMTHNTTSYGNSTILRLMHTNSDYSFNFKDVIVNNSKPVVLAHGIHSDLFTWNDFGNELANNPTYARDVWLIEMYGGPTTDCPTCPVYNFDDLKYNYWPALIAGVEKYSGQNTVDYVGYDLGCTVALESLENYSNGKNNAGYCFNPQTGMHDIDCDLSQNPIDSFVGIGCIGKFTPSADYEERNLPLFAEIINTTNYDDLPSYYTDRNHIPGGIYKWKDFAVGYVKDKIATEPAFEGVLIYYFKVDAVLASKIVKGSAYVLLPLSLIEESDKNYFPPDSNSLSRGVYKDIQSWMRNNQINVGEGVHLNNALIIQSTQTEAYEVPYLNIIPYVFGLDSNPLYDKGTDGFINGDNIKQICTNINVSGTKYYANIDDRYHFTGAIDKLFKTSLPDDKIVRALTELFINGHDLNNNPDLEKYILSNNTNCE